MKLVVVCLLVCLTLGDNWAVLIAGSNTYSNYRHQADVYHSYQLMLKGGFDPERIITFAYDDIASHLTNPFRGKVFNKPTYKNPGEDVYHGVKLDYTKLAVTPEHFQAVLEGNKSAVAGKGTGRVLESTSEDNVFIFFSDHGAPGLIAFPHSHLYADKLLATFTKMQGRYKKIVFYLEVHLC
jgi:legumain